MGFLAQLPTCSLIYCCNHLGVRKRYISEKRIRKTSSNDSFNFRTLYELTNALQGKKRKPLRLPRKMTGVFLLANLNLLV